MTIERMADIAHVVVNRGVLRFGRNGYCERTPMRIPSGFMAVVNVPIVWALPTRSVSMPSKLIPQAELTVPTIACGPSPTDWQGREHRQDVPLYPVLSKPRVCRTGLLTETSSSKLRTSPLGGESIWSWGPVLIWKSACDSREESRISMIFLTLLLCLNRSCKYIISVGDAATGAGIGATVMGQRSLAILEASPSPCCHYVGDGEEPG